MNYDTVTVNFLRSFYETYSKEPNSIDSFYGKDAKLIVSLGAEPQKSSTTNRNSILPGGEHVILRWNGQKSGDQIIGHVTGYVKITIDDEAQTAKYYQSNEMVVYIHNQETPPFLILHHSIYLNEMDPPPQPKDEPKSETNPETRPDAKIEAKTDEKSDQKSDNQNDGKANEKVNEKIDAKIEVKSDVKNIKKENEKTPQNNKKEEPKKSSATTPPSSHGPREVENPNSLIKSRTVLATNLPFNLPQVNIIPEFEIYGKITRYAVVKGRILMEFENPASLDSALNDGDFRWQGRLVRIKAMENGFS
ncbi:hypothetical protein TRFO_36989 [Tritrichomonas foetus]|uniref:RRM domain-containing protein n=1 Tax=Tritrichomonas foetus TaxID=1144522 RepID=A0A1J4JDN8_9EUKA|nr:hypothetical protein TRFO_36989 [Tritrichomonas foetus]|eukprot:OHS96769.1 hypothetical protein TRFO_36989 [Tritrichomonas foetus]